MSREFVPPSGSAADAGPGAIDAPTLKLGAFDHAPLGMALADRDGILVEVNDAYAEIVGGDPRHLVGTALRETLHAAEADAPASLVDAFFAGDRDSIRAESVLLHADGRVVWVSVNASWVRDDDGRPLYLIGLFEDITARKTATVAMAEAEERFRTTFEQAPIGMVLTDTTGIVLRVNPAYCAIVGRGADFLVGAKIALITHPDDVSLTATHVDALTAGEVDAISMEKRYLHPDGHVVWVSVSASCVWDASGEPLYLIGQIKDITERREMRERLVHAAIHDPLTGLPNRELFVDRLDMALRRSCRGGHRVAVMFIDLDGFKVVNDSLGHEVGDRLLRAVADRMSSALRSSDTLARFGGDEFTILCDDVTDEAHVLEIAERIRSTLREPLTVVGGKTKVSFSMGIALSTGGDDNASTLVRHADIAMYRAKESGPSRVQIYTEDDHQFVKSRLRTSNELHGALDRHELELLYQPYVDLRTRTMIGLKASVQWRHPVRGLLPPAEFMPLAEEIGLTVPLGAWTLEAACRQAVLWSAGRRRQAMDENRLNIAVNVSAAQLADPGFCDLIAEILETTGMNPDRLWLELTESTLMRDADATITILGALRRLGLHLGIGGSGTGYSSLSHLRRFPLETLKIDDSFVADVDRGSADTAIVKAIIGLGDSLGLAVIAVGVERWTQVRQLQALGCHLAQGNLLGRPLRAHDLGDFPTDDLHAWHGLLVSSTT